MFAKSDLRFVETAWNLIRKELGINPKLTSQQFLSMGFAMNKADLLFNTIKHVQSLISLNKKDKSKSGQSSSQYNIKLGQTHSNANSKVNSPAKINNKGNSI